jgi:hypothetical protein
MPTITTRPGPTGAEIEAYERQRQQNEQDRRQLPVERRTEAGQLDIVLAIILKRAEGLRAAGVREVAWGGVRFTLDPAAPAAPEKDDTPKEAKPPPLRDPETYGSEDGRIPGLRRFEEYDNG